jgi:hypothetical protein
MVRPTYQELLEANRQLRQFGTQLAADLAQVRLQLASQQVAPREQEAAIRRQQGVLTGQQSAFHDRHADLQRYVEQVRSDQRRLREQAQALEAQRLSLTQEQAALEHRRADLAEAHKMLQHRQAEFTDLQARSDSLARDRRDLRAQQAALVQRQEQLDRWELRLADKQHRLEELESRSTATAPIGKGHAGRHWGRWTAGITTGLAGLAALGFFAATSRPSWYQPVTVRPEEYAILRNQVPNFCNDIGIYLKAGQPFRITLPQEEINRWLAARGEIWPGLRDVLPSYIVDPVVSFQPGRIVLAARYDQSGLSSVLSLAVNLRLEAGGDEIHVEVGSLRAGYLPVPRALVDGLARKILVRQTGKHLDPLARCLSPQTGEYLLAGDPLESRAIDRVPSAGMSGEIWQFRLPTRSRWPNGGFPYSIAALRVEQGTLTIDVVPTPRQARRSRRSGGNRPRRPPGRQRCQEECQGGGEGDPIRFDVPGDGRRV